MPKCPNCNYELTLLEHRRKYKCSKCSRVFSQIKIDADEFRKMNKTERIKEKKEARKEATKAYRKLHPEKCKEWADRYYKKNKEKIKQRQKEWREKNNRRLSEYSKNYRTKDKEGYNAKQREYWAKHREHLTKKRRENYSKKKAQISTQQKLYRENNKTLRMINALRWEQKELALKVLKNKEIIAYNNEFQRIMPTLALY
jgi:DNA-directed RNA polymerase subunit RPC12/RpoP